MSSVDEKEIRALQWWHDHHKGNAQYLVMRLEQYFAGDLRALDMIKAAMQGYRDLYTGVTESETEAKTTN